MDQMYPSPNATITLATCTSTSPIYLFLLYHNPIVLEKYFYDNRMSIFQLILYLSRILLSITLWRVDLFILFFLYKNVPT